MKQFLKDIITEAGDITLTHRARLSDIQVNHKSAKDLVTEADLAVEQYLVNRIKDAYPDHSILGEESGTHTGNEYRWIIDPIDGTTSFVHNQPFYSVSVALEKAGRLILGAVFVPVLDELFMAELGKGATCNGKPIHVSNREKLSDCVLATGFACVRSDLSDNNIPHFVNILPCIRGIRRYGSAAIDLAYVAAGKHDGYWELNLKIYDVAAGILMVTEAGGTVTDFAGINQNDIPAKILATNGLIHNELSGLLMNPKNEI